MQQDVFWTSEWFVKCGVVERNFTLVEDQDTKIIPRFRAQIQGFDGSVADLYLTLVNATRAIEGDLTHILQNVVDDGRAIFSIAAHGDGSIVIAVEHDPTQVVGDGFEEFVETLRLEGVQTGRLSSAHPNPANTPRIAEPEGGECVPARESRVEEFKEKLRSEEERRFENPGTTPTL